MSFILDALKKSETDRQQQGSAEFAGVPSSTAPTTAPKWLWIVGLLLAINLAFLIGMFIQSDVSPPAQSTTTSGDRVTDTAPAGDGSQSSFEARAEAARRNQPVEQPAQTSPEVVDDAVELVQPVLISQNPDAVSAANLYPTFQEVRARGSINLVDLHIDMHFYAAESEDRFAFINMSKLREGEQLKEGPVVAEITPDGVVLGHEGQYFLLPRE